MAANTAAQKSIRCVDCKKTPHQKRMQHLSGIFFGCEYCQRPLCDECAHLYGGIYLCQECWDEAEPLPEDAEH